MRDSLIPRSARVPRTSSLRKLTRSRAISTASRSLDTPSDVRASSSSRGSSQNALRTFPIRVARGPVVVTRARADRRRFDGVRRRVDVGTGPRFRTPRNSISYVRCVTWPQRERRGLNSSTHHTQGSAIEAGKRVAARDNVELVTHATSGRIRSKDSYGDESRKKDREH